MWAGAWPQWPLQQSMYQNVPHEQVDWAALAKQWIQMQHVQKPEVRPPEPMPVSHPILPLPTPEPLLPPPPPTAVAKVPLLSDPIIPPEVPMIDVHPHIEPPMQPGSDNYLQSDTKGGSFWHGRWEGDSVSNESWPAPPAAEDSFEFGHMHGNQHLQAQSYDYNHGSDHFGYNQDFSSDAHFGQYWVDQASAIPPFVRQEKKLRAEDTPLLHTEEEVSHGMGQLDAAKRKQLPAWIREGLEKMERQRQKKMEGDKRFITKATKPAVEAAKDPSSSPKGYIAERSRFESESEGEDEVAVKETNSKSLGPSDKHLSSSPIPENLSEEEKRQEVMLRVRRMLTEILLGVTNEELYAVAKEVYQRARSKAPARQLVSSSALASIVGGLGGLADYGSEDSDDQGGEEDEEEDSDDELDRRIREKQKAFASKEREIVARLDEEEAAEKERLKNKQEAASTSEESSDKKVPGETSADTSTPPANPELSEKAATDLKIETTEKVESDTKKDSSSEVIGNGSQDTTSGGSQESDSSSSSSSTSSSSSVRRKKSSSKRRKSGESRKSRSKRSSSRESEKRSSKKSSKRRSRSRDRGKDRDGRRESGSSRKSRHKSKTPERRRSRSRSRDRSSRRRRSRSTEKRRRSNEGSSKRRSRSRSVNKSRRQKSRSRSRDRDSKYKSKSKSKRRSQSKSPKRGRTKGDRSPSPKRSKRKRSRSSSSDSERSGKKSSGKK